MPIEDVVLYPSTLCSFPFCVFSWRSFTPLLNKYADSKMKKRILIFNCSENPVSSFINAMNDAFCFQSRCPIDICQLDNTNNLFLKKLSLLTHGNCVRAQSSASLYGLLSYYFLPDISVRKLMCVPEEGVENMKVMCSCHGNPLSSDCAYVCTVCLAILCNPSCSCHTVIPKGDQ